MKKLLYPVSVLAILVVSCLVVLKLCSMTISTPPIAIATAHVNHSNEFVVFVRNNSDEPLFEINLEFEHLPHNDGHPDIKKYRLLRLESNKEAELTTADLDGWPIRENSQLTFQAKGYLFPNMVYITDNPNEHTKGR